MRDRLKRYRGTERCGPVVRPWPGNGYYRSEIADKLLGLDVYVLCVVLTLAVIVALCRMKLHFPSSELL